MKQYSEACEQNKDPILAILRAAFMNARNVLEIGSGTGQHAVYFSEQLPQLRWQTSDLPENHPGIHAWLQEAELKNALAPVALDTRNAAWPQQTPEKSYDGLFSANTTHIMDWPAVEGLFAGVGELLESNGRFCLYGPFNYQGAYSSDSNQRFDDCLKARDPASGIRHFEELDSLANENNMALESDHEMPVNNRLLVWRKR
jgi:cyclopropane fatty-acyl-phospholipid synthase-like methyltransferase